VLLNNYCLPAHEKLIVYRQDNKFLPNLKKLVFQPATLQMMQHCFAGLHVARDSAYTNNEIHDT